MSRNIYRVISNRFTTLNVSYCFLDRNLILQLLSDEICSRCFFLSFTVGRAESSLDSYIMFIFHTMVNWPKTPAHTSHTSGNKSRIYKLQTFKQYHHHHHYSPPPPPNTANLKVGEDRGPCDPLTKVPASAKQSPKTFCF